MMFLKVVVPALLLTVLVVVGVGSVWVLWSATRRIR